MSKHRKELPNYTTKSRNKRHLSCFNCVFFPIRVYTVPVSYHMLNMNQVPGKLCKMLC